MQPDTIERMREFQAFRKHCIRIVTSNTNTNRSLIMRAMGYSTQKGSAEKEIKDRAARMLAHVINTKGEWEDVILKAPAKLGIDDARLLDGSLGTAMRLFRNAVRPYKLEWERVESEMEALAADLPLAHMADGRIPGFALFGLAILVGEAGDFTAYDRKDKLRKRLGLAPYNGLAGSTWGSEKRRGDRKALTNAEWISLGYSKHRLAQVVGCVTTPLFMAKAKSKFGEIYNARRAHTAITHPDWKPGHSDADARRYMTQRLVSDLWSEWRRATWFMPQRAMIDAPASTPIAA